MRVGVLGLRRARRRRGAKLQAHRLRRRGLERDAQERCPAFACFAGADGLDTLLARTDILVVLVPLTARRAGISTRRCSPSSRKDGRLGGPILINAGRGGLQVEADILAALDAGALKGASLDVFEREPLPADSPLWAHPAVYVSPHNAAISTPEAIAPASSGRSRHTSAASRCTISWTGGGGIEAGRRVSPLLAGYGIHTSKIAARTPSPACGGRWREAPDGVWPAASGQVALHDRHREPFINGSRSPHPIRRYAAPSPLRGEATVMFAVARCSAGLKAGATRPRLRRLRP